MKQRKPLTEGELCVLKEMVLRTGIVYRPDVRLIAEECKMDFPDVLTLVNGQSAAGRDINKRVDEAISHVPIGSKDRQMAYAQVILNDKLSRRKKDSSALTDKDPLEVLEFARRVANPSGNVNVAIQNNAFAEPQVFDFSALPIDKLQAMISKLQNAIDTGDIVDAEFTELIPADDVPALSGRTGGIDTEDSAEGRENS